MGNINYNDHFEVGIVSPSYKIFTIAEKYDKTFIASMLKTQRSLYRDCREIPKKVFNFLNELIDNVIKIS